MYEMKTDDVYEDFSMKPVNAAIITIFTIEKFAEMRLKMFSFLADDNSEHKNAYKQNAKYKMRISRISHNEYKDLLLNNKCWGHSVNRN